MRHALKSLIPEGIARGLVRTSRRVLARPSVGTVSMGDLGLTPISRKFGGDRGTPVDRYYIERFLQEHEGLVRGEVLEFGDDTYTRRFGSSVTRREVLHPTTGNPAATLVADLENPSSVPPRAFDCIIATQVLPFVYDLRAAMESVHIMLRPGGVAVMTAPGISQISRYDAERWGDYWRLTSQSFARLLGAHYATRDLQIVTYGNVLAATAFLYGLSAEDLDPAALEPVDADYELIIGAVARKR